MAILGLVMTRPLLMVLKIRKEYLTPVVFTLCLLGPYALSQRLFDLYVMLVFGVIGFLLRQMKYPMAPLILGIILGGMIDQNFRRALVLAARDPLEFATRPITVALILLCLATLFVGGATMARVRGLLRRRAETGGRA